MDNEYRLSLIDAFVDMLPDNATESDALEASIIKWEYIYDEIKLGFETSEYTMDWEPECGLCGYHNYARNRFDACKKCILTLNGQQCCKSTSLFDYYDEDEPQTAKNMLDFLISLRSKV